MGREYSKLSCGCLTSCDSGGGLLGKCSSNSCQFGIWMSKHQMCETCNECLNCEDHSDHLKNLDGLTYLKNIFGL